MGFINDKLWSIRLTKKGREYLFKDSSRFSLDKISLSDEGINYSLIKEDESYDNNIIEMPNLEASTFDRATIIDMDNNSNALVHKSFTKTVDTDDIPEFDYRIACHYYGSNCFVLNNTILDQYFDVSFYYLAPNKTSLQDAFLPHSVLIDTTNFLKYYSFAFDFIPIYPSTNISSSLGSTASPYWFRWEQQDDLRQKIIARNSSVDDWQLDEGAVYNSLWNVSDKYVDDDSIFVPLPDYRTFDSDIYKAVSVTFRLKIKREYLSRLYKYMTRFKTDMIRDFIYIVNNDETIVPETSVYGSKRFNVINRAIPIYITR